MTPALSRAAHRDRGARLTFPALPATCAEVERVALRARARFADEPATLLTGRAATEAALKRLGPGRRCLHLATHGFFATGQMRSALDTRGSAGIGIGAEAGARAENTPVAGFNPMLLSGVVLAGANGAKGGADDDGILTALEVSALSLDGVDLVVLSACETGLGEVKRGEGVLGLAQGFRLAGARKLWKVPDEATAELMTRLYGEVWSDRPVSAVEGCDARSSRS